MAIFKIKDLSINIVDSKIPDLGKLCRFPTKIACTMLVTKIACKLLTNIPCACTHLASIPCGAGTDPCTCTGCYASEILWVNIKDLVINPESIAGVREELNVLMEAAQKQSAVVATAMAPATKAQVAAVKAQLTEALKSLG
jgi:hypothetical protein